jgi:pyruvate,water dikinase
MVDDAAVEWKKPGPGTWELDSSHAGPAPGPIQRDLYEEALPAGMKEGLSRFGAPISHMEMHWVHGKFYRRLVPIVGGNRDLPAPPKPLLWLAARVHPELRRQERLATNTFATKSWQEELDRWESEWKPNLVAANRAFTAVDVHALDDAELLDHLEAVHDHLRDHTRLHFRLHVSDMGPLGILMVQLEDAGLHRDDTFRALVNASPATAAPAESLRRIAGALRDAGVDPAGLTSLDQVREASPDAARYLDDHLQEYGWRLTTGYDIEDRCLAELPDVLLTSIRGAASGEATADDAHLAPIAALRDEVPAEHRKAFDEAVTDARQSYGLRDENGPLTYEWPAGILRRGLLEAGRRLSERGAISHADEVFELRIPEVAALLSGAIGPSRAEIEERAATRRWEAGLDAPARLGPEEAPPPADALTPSLARMTRVVLTVVGSLEADPGRESLQGMGIGTDAYVGTARVVHDAGEALATMEPGDIVVAPYTAPTYNAVLAMAGAIVTEEGGLLCHAAVIARELGLPAVIGASGAMTAIPDGATIEVDPVAGRVLVK